MKTLLAIINVVFLLFMLAWPTIYPISIFLFGIPGAGESVAAFMFVMALWFYPVPAVIGNILFWARRKKGSIKQLSAFTVVSSLGYLYIAGNIFVFVNSSSVF